MEDTYTSLTKCINSESKQYKPVLTDKLILDDVPTVNSLNAITSDAVARAVAGASGEVPAVTENDNGKVLKAVYDAGGPAVEWGEAAPAVTVDQTYNALSENAQSGVAVAEAIAAIPAPSVDEVPDVTSSDDGKVLTASYSGGSGSYSWQTAQGGGASYTAGTGIKINNDEISAKFGLNSGLIADWNYDTVATQGDYISGYTQQMAIYQTTIKQLQITSSYCGGRLCVIIRPAYFSGSLGFRDTGLDQSTGWTVIAYDSSDPENKYAYATESYPYESTSSSGYYKATVMEARSNKPDKYFVFTFSTGNVHGDLSANSTCFAVVPKPGEGFTGTSPWGVPVADYIQPEGIITNSDGWNCPVSGSGTVDYTYLKIQRAIPSYSKTTDVGKVLQVQADGTLKWVSLS